MIRVLRPCGSGRIFATSASLGKLAPQRRQVGLWLGKCIKKKGALDSGANTFSVRCAIEDEMLDTREVAALLQEYGQRASLRGGNPYRARAYRKAAISVR
jgi:hypothetical protein